MPTQIGINEWGTKGARGGVRVGKTVFVKYSPLSVIRPKSKARIHWHHLSSFMYPTIATKDVTYHAKAPPNHPKSS